MQEPRFVQLRKWMNQYNVTYSWLAAQLGISATAVKNLLVKETMPTLRHAEFCRIGVPSDLLPQPIDLPTGPQRRIPTFVQDAGTGA